jgi:sugar lactone lactonase YvrE/PKD repeat protein
MAGVSSFGEYGSGPGQFLQASALAVDSDGYVYAADGFTARVQKFDGAGNFVSQFTTAVTTAGQWYQPGGLAVDASGHIYVSDSVADNAVPGPLPGYLKKFDPAGNLVWAIQLTEGQHAAAVRIDAADNLFVLSYGEPVPYVTRFDPQNGAVLSQWTWGDGSGERVFAPTDLATDTDGNLYLAMWSRRVDVVDPSGKLLRSFPEVGPSGFHLDVDSSGHLYAGDTSLVRRFDARHELVGEQNVNGYPRRIAAGPSGLVYVLREHDVVRIDPSTPVASLTVSPSLALTGQQVTFDASASSVPLSSITRYEWDLDGDGTFETDTGATPVASRSYAERGEIRVSVRVTAESGITDTAEAALTVRLASPPGAVGVSINAGAQFTNDPNVTLSVRWPAFATSLLIANDGGFTDAVTVPVDASIPWTLDSSGPERLPKTIYVRFQGGQSGPETYQDDIILDQTPPTIDGVRASARGSGEAHRYRLQISASDDLSGVAQMQITNDVANPGDLVPFEPKTQIRTRSRKLLVRVQDEAGNFSPWRKVRR